MPEVTGNIGRKDREGVSPNKKLAMEVQAGGTETKGRKTKDQKAHTGTLWMEVVPPLLLEGARQGAEWLRQP